MAQNQGISMPAGFGGLTRFKEEYVSKIILSPTHVVGFIIFIIAIRILLPLIF